MSKKPIRTKFSNKIEYRLNGVLHREDGPALIKDDGSWCWYFNGVFHRKDGPAVIWDDGTLSWYNRNGQMHREDGPAIVYFNGKEYSYLNGRRVENETNQNDI